MHPQLSICRPSFGRIAFHALALAGLASLVGCGPVGGGIDTGTVGVTGGGEQDIARARSSIQSGYIPDPNSITVEGFLSEHDIPLARPENAATLYPTIGVAWRVPYGEPAPMGDLFVGFGTTIDLDAFQRPPLNLVVVVDRSGSMGDVASPIDGRSKMEAVRQSLQALAGQLTNDDLLTLISFEARNRLDLPTRGADDVDAIHSAIDKLKAEGATNIYDALKQGFQQAAAAQNADRADRVFLFTDAQPNVGPEGSDQFVALVQHYADQGVGFTLLGVGYDFGDALAKDLSRVRGANSFYLSDAERIATVFNEDFKFLVTPAAYDVVLDVVVAPQIGVRAVYGVPDDVPGSRGARVSLPTLFFSRREGGGAIVVRLTTAQTPDFTTAVTFGSATLSYTLTDGTSESSTLDLTMPADASPTADPAYYSDPTLRRAALLLDTALALRRGTELASLGLFSDAAKHLTSFLKYFDQASLGLSDRTDASSRSLTDERKLVERLLALLR